ncbi:cytochrome P450 [Flammula alnicola]|nr:cytochrome P450 [Flammula alnicola]
MYTELTSTTLSLGVLTLVALLVTANLLNKYLRRATRYPPGPFGWPVLGNILGLPLKGTWKSVTELKKTYGDLIFFHGLGNNLLVLNSMEAINDLLEKRGSIYSDRPIFTVVGELMGLDQGMPLKPYGEEWREQRKIAHVALSHGAVKKYCKLQEHLALSLCDDIIEKPLDFASSVRLTAGRIIVAVTYGINVESAQSEFITMAEETMELIGKATVPGAYICDLIPILKYLPKWFSFRKEAAKGKVMIEEFISKPFRQAQRDISLGCAPPSLVKDILLSEEVSPGHDNTIKWAAGSMYGAGAETTYATVLTFIMAMALHPDRQNLAHAEIDRVIGSGRMPQLQDRNDLPYLDAIIKETSRWHPVLPLSIARRTNIDDYYRGFYIPKGTIIIPNVWAIAFSHNDRYDPQAFIPERFMDANCSQIDPAVWNFGFGRRICPGKALAENSVFILIASIIWTFRFSLDESEVLVPRFSEGLVSYPEPFKCKISPRSDQHRRLVKYSVVQESY